MFKTDSNDNPYDWKKGSWKILKLIMKESKFLIHHQMAYRFHQLRI